MLSFLGPDARSPTGGAMTIKSNILPSNSSQPSSLVLNFKDGKVMHFVELNDDTKEPGKMGDDTWDLRKMGTKDIVEEVDRHSRLLMRKDDLAG